MQALRDPMSEERPAGTARGGREPRRRRQSFVSPCSLPLLFWEIKRKKKVIFILTCLEFSKVNGWLALLYANVTGVATQGPGGREGLPHKGRV